MRNVAGSQLRVFGNYSWRSSLRPPEPERPTGLGWLVPTLMLLEEGD